ncbi:HAMP domain-containing sensor histidine kinase [Sphingomonas sp. AR_OL41]|uniref:HAMP domain-containing sensor histidine kinase n=1 Tax=Sphingomonas sp. AR_OL41 TaxID=3042729 RepID=UPI0024818B19|nr:HAMP domain-containing sensor histidine kinase [Sphingomonas sp. AR_OL41]MDH7972592.1 HAMP domain-containing sensor histidine kinase [Sphingomonas sp. AR_OL41]
MAAIFAIGAAALLFMVEQSVRRYASEVANDSIAAEVAVLREESRATGMAETIRSVVRRENAAREHQLRYLLVDRSGKYLAGSLPASVAQPGWHTVTLPNHDPDNDDGAATMSLTALGARLDDGATLVVASDTSDLDELRWGLGLWSAAFGLLITALALVGGFVVGSVFLRRLDRVNRSVERIMQGSLAERLPTIGMSPEFDHLSANLNRMLARIESLMEGMRQVSTDIAHDLRTPLTRLRQRLEAMRDSMSGAAEEQVDAALAQVDEILGIFRALLRISSLEAGAGRRRIIEVDLSSLMLRVVSAYRAVAEDSGHFLSDTIEADVVGRADPEMLTQAVTNLIDNAIVHTPSGSHVSVALERRSDGIAIIVADDGPGVPASERGRILERFYRRDDSRNTPGAGLGLALVSAVASIHEATLLMTDNLPGLRAELLLLDPHVARQATD